jgi:hypothetical protein
MLRFPKHKRTKHQEADLQGLCEHYLEAMGLQYVRIPDAVLGYLARPSTPPPIRKLVGDYMRGQPDLIVLYAGRALHIELKSDVGRVRDSQNSWAKGLELNVVRDFDTFRELVERWANAQGCALCDGKKA